MLAENGGLVCMFLVVTGGEEVVVIMGEMMGKVFNVWIIESVLMLWVMLSASVTARGDTSLFNKVSKLPSGLVWKGSVM